MIVRRGGLCGLIVTLAIVALGALGAGSAFAARPWWRLSSAAKPSYIAPGGEGEIVVRALNLGDEAVVAGRCTNVGAGAGKYSGSACSEEVAPGTGEWEKTSLSPVTITDTLPPGLVATKISGRVGAFNITGSRVGEFGGEATCAALPALSCTWAGVSEPLQPYEPIEMTIGVENTGPVSAPNEASVSGGYPFACNVSEEENRGTGHFTTPGCEQDHISETVSGGFEGEMREAEPVPAVSVKRNVIVSGEKTPFGVADYGMALENEAGGQETQAGKHPFQFTTTFEPNQTALPDHPPALVKNVNVNLPPGLIGNPTVLAQCTEVQFSTVVEGNTNLCPADTQVGVAVVNGVVSLSHELEPDTFTVPIYSLVPSPGEPARFGFEIEKVPTFIDTSVRTGRNYEIVASVDNQTQVLGLVSATLTLWGVPGATSHDSSRGWNCLAGGGANPGNSLPLCKPQNESKPPPFMTLPSACTGELQSTVEAESWKGERVFKPSYQEPMQALTGCGNLSFAADIAVSPDVQEASKPSGLSVDVHVPQEASLNATGIAGSDVKDITVALPEGVTLNPAGAGGLEACSEPQIGYEPENSSPPGTLDFSPKTPEPLSPGLELGAEGFCPNASKIGTAKITLPVLTHPLEGSVYLASQNANPFGSLLAIYIVAEDPVSGVLVKLPGDVSLNPSTGQITATFENTPQAPFEDAEVHFFGGERSPLSTPAHCGTYTTTASIAPWSGNPAVDPSSSFQITSGRGGSACPGSSLPFSPSLTAGTTSNQAGGYSPFSMTMSREDGQQNLKSVSLHMPPGLSGALTGVPLCGEAEANAGTCGEASKIGETTVSVGVGGQPYTVTGGKVYLTGPYAGAPFGLSIVNPAKAGPFDLEDTPANHPACDCLVVRAKIEVNPQTAQLTVTSNESGPYEIPPSIEGIPLQIQHVNVTINRSGFTFNPTNCDAQTISGTLGSIEGASAALSVPFQATNCASLKFQPKFAASVPALSTKAGGAGLSVKLTYPKTAQGTEANISKVKVDLPKQLPSRLTTLQKACVAKVFEANPAGCPKESKVGYAKATTPILPVPLEGPAYFVSHGGEAFPSLIMVLQGYGVTVELVGTTFISKAGITSSTFKTVPDVPVGSFELTLPTGKFSALAANLPAKDKHSFCGTKLAMPTAFVAQNGAEIHESTAIGVSGCPKAKKATKKKQSKKSKKHSKNQGGRS